MSVKPEKIEEGLGVFENEDDYRKRTRMKLRKQVELVLRKHPGHDDKQHGNWAKRQVSTDELKSLSTKLNYKEDADKEWLDLGFGQGEEILRMSDIVEHVKSKLPKDDDSKYDSEDAVQESKGSFRTTIGDLRGQRQTPEPYIMESEFDKKLPEISKKVNAFLKGRGE